MLNSRIRNAIEFRLGPLINYTFSGGFYWEPKLQKYISTSSYSHWNCKNAFYYYCLHIGHLLLLHFLVSTYQERFYIEDKELRQTNILIIFITIIYWIGYVVMISLTSVVQQYNKEIIEFFNNVYIVDEKFRKLFPNCPTNTNRLIKTIEAAVVHASYLTMIIPFFYPSIMIPKLSPIYIMFHDYLEIDLEVSWKFVPLFILCVYGALVMVNVIYVIHMMCALYAFMSLGWLSKVMPKVNLMSSMTHSKLNVIETEVMGWVDVAVVVHVYRTLHSLSILMNSSLAKVRIAIHTKILSYTASIGAVVIIRRNALFLEQDDGYTTAIYVFMGILVGLFAIAVLQIRVECLFFEEMENAWQQCKSRLERYKGCKKEVNKTAKSFSPIRFNIGYPFCFTDKAMYMEWWNDTLNNIVNFLVSFS